MDLSIFNDISLISFDDADCTIAIIPPLTVVSQPIRELDAAVTEDRVALLTGEQSDTGEETLLTATFIESDSVSLARAGPRISHKSQKVSSYFFSRESLLLIPC